MDQILREPLDDPFQPDIVVVQNQGMARWVSQQLALQSGIAANLSFPLPASFVWDVFLSRLGQDFDNQAFEREPLLWRIFALLGQLPDNDKFQPLNYYLADDPSRTKRYQLARSITDTFDQYIVYRPDMLATWEQEEENHWQSILWRHLVADTGLHRGRLLHDYLKATEKDIAVAAEHLPERVCLFGINTLAPAYLEVMLRISRHTEVHLFHLSPCRQFWGDLLSSRSQARLRGKSAKGQHVEEAYYDEGNPLLASMGRVAQDFFRQLMEYDVEETDIYQESSPSTLLACIQNDILDLMDRTRMEKLKLPNCGSIAFHSCHSPTREVQVLHDRLLDSFEIQKDLAPGDILVMVPDIEQYTDAIRGVFGGADPSRHIPWALADRSWQRESQTISGFFNLLELFSGRCTASDILGLLEIQAVQDKFHLDQEALQRIHDWVGDSGIRWGLHLDHQKEFSKNPSYLHTWEFGMDRLLLGYLMDPGNADFADISPFRGSDDSEMEIIGEMAALIRELTGWQHRLQEDTSASGWCERLQQLIDTFFLPDCDPEGLQTLRSFVQEFGSHCIIAGFADPLNLETVRHHFQHYLSRPASGQAFLTGRVTFCNMIPMRSVPFRVLCLLGMNDADFPRSQQPVNFDLMAAAPRVGDRNRRNDDRYLFLEALLSARDHLHISWVGRDQHNDTEIPPSVLVSELQDYIDGGFISDHGSSSKLLTTQHPLQPFSIHCFNASRESGSYAHEWLPDISLKERMPFLTEPLPEPDASFRQLTVDQLSRFWAHPVRYFLNKRLGLYPGEADLRIEDAEPFCLDNLQQFFLSQDLTDKLLAGDEGDEIQKDYSREGLLPYNAFGDCQFATLEKRSQALLTTLKPLITAPQPPLEINLRLDNFHISGILEDLYAQGRVTWRNSKLNGSTNLHAWIGHLLLNICAPKEVRPVTIHVARDQTIVMHPVNQPEELLRPLLDWYWLGLSHPLAFYPSTSLAWIQAAKPEQREREALKKWRTAYRYKGEEEDECYRLVLGNASPITEEFEQLATLFSVMIEHTESYSAAS